MKRSHLHTFLALSAFALLVACDPYEPTMRPDYAIRVVPTAQGSAAIAPACPSWSSATTDPYDNQPLPQYGCATARNLALTIENPNDLIQGRPLANSRGVTEVGSIRRYDNNQTRGLITPDAEVSQVAATTAATGSSTLTGDVTGGPGATTSSSSSGASAAAP